MKRFISPDPLGIDGGANVYMWANMNPLWFVDPYGLEASDVAILRDAYNQKLEEWIDAGLRMDASGAPAGWLNNLLGWYGITDYMGCWDQALQMGIYLIGQDTDAIWTYTAFS